MGHGFPPAHVQSYFAQDSLGYHYFKKKKKKPTQNAPAFDLSHELERISGVDLTRIDGIDALQKLCLCLGP